MSDLRVVPSETLVQLSPRGFWIASNPAARTHLLLDMAGLEFLALFARPFSRGEAIGRFGGRKILLRDLTRFPHEDGLLADPTGMDRTGEKEPAEADPVRAVEELEGLLLLVAPGGGHRDRYGPKRNLLDRERIGTMHQRLGQELRLVRRIDPEAWWKAQKFLPDMSGIRPGLYREVQEAWIRSFFSREKLRGKRLLDFACGTGYFANLFAEAGAEVTGVDPSSTHIEEARRRFVRPGLRFERIEIGPEGPKIPFPEESFDLVFASDVLLLYFVDPARPAHPPSPRVALDALRRLLRPGGSFCAMEPHGVFYHQSWFGREDFPIAVLSEYRTHRYRVVPTLEEISTAFDETGFDVRRIHEPVPPPGTTGPDPLATAFACEFPTWWVFECAPRVTPTR